MQTNYRQYPVGNAGGRAVFTKAQLLGRAVVACVAAGCTALLLSPARKTVAAADQPGQKADAGWDPAAAARYLDAREVWWQGWERAQKDQGTYCISCHTQVPYALARPLLRRRLGQPGPGPSEQAMLASIEKRVRLWNEVEPFYLDARYGAGKAIESRNAEAVLNAIILASYDAQHGKQSEIARLAFQNALELQSTSGPNAGAWVWQNFHYSPWESDVSQYYWAAQMAIAISMEPPSFPQAKRSLLFTGRDPAAFASNPNIGHKLRALLAYLRNHYQEQPLINKVMALRVEHRLPGIVNRDQEQKLLHDVNRLQHADGGWSLADLGPWKRVDGTPLETRSDGFATGLIVLSREEALVRPESVPQLARGIEWLKANQNRETGAWPAWSVNKNRDPQSPVGKFMSDAATGYAVLALEKSSR